MSSENENVQGVEDNIYDEIKKEFESINEIFRDVLNFLDHLPEEPGREEMNAWKSKLKHKIFEMILDNIDLDENLIASSTKDVQIGRFEAHR